MTKRLLLSAIVGCLAAGLLAGSASAVMVRGPNPDGYFGCEGDAYSPDKRNGIIGANGVTDCGFHHPKLELTVCLQVNDVIDGWLNLRCMADCRGQECTWGSGTFYYTSYALLVTYAGCYNPRHGGSWYRTWVSTRWPFNAGWHSSAALTPPVYIPC